MPDNPTGVDNAQVQDAELLGNSEQFDAKAREVERFQCCQDVCMYCAGHALGYGLAEGPNEAGNWVHRHNDTDGRDVLCLATGIYSRDRYLRATAIERAAESPAMDTSPEK